MLKRMLSAVVTSSVVLALAADALAASATLSGRAYEAPDGRPLPSLAVRLVPPQASKLPPYVTATSSDGAYRLQGLPPGRYVLEARQGSTLVYRQLVDVEGDTTRDIALKAKP